MSDLFKDVSALLKEWREHGENCMTEIDRLIAERDSLHARIAKLEAQNRDLHKAIQTGGGCVEDGGLWEDRALAAESCIDDLKDERDEFRARIAELEAELECPDCKRVGRTNMMDVQRVCELCGHREAI